MSAANEAGLNRSSNLFGKAVTGVKSSILICGVKAALLQAGNATRDARNTTACLQSVCRLLPAPIAFIFTVSSFSSAAEQAEMLYSDWDEVTKLPEEA